jgi:hypothetical protein
MLIGRRSQATTSQNFGRCSMLRSCRTFIRGQSQLPASGGARLPHPVCCVYHSLVRALRRSRKSPSSSPAAPAHAAYPAPLPDGLASTESWPRSRLAPPGTSPAAPLPERPHHGDHPRPRQTFSLFSRLPASLLCGPSGGPSPTGRPPGVLPLCPVPQRGPAATSADARRHRGRTGKLRWPRRRR